MVLVDYILLQIPNNVGFLQEQGWKYYLKEKRFLWGFAVSALVLIVTAAIFSKFLVFAEHREGVDFNDPILALFEPRNFSLTTFLLTYGSVVAIIAINFKRPPALVQMLQLYTLLLLARIVTIYCWPLHAPDSIIVLADPFLDTFIYQVHNLRDLFFSGHTATVFIFALTLQSKALKSFFMVISGVIGTLLILQHVHYSVDVFAAPIFAWLLFIVHKKLFSRRLSSVSS